MPHYQFIAAPAEKTKQATVEHLRAAIATPPHDHAEVFPFEIPDFKVGTLDSLMTMTDELGRADATVEVQVYKLIDSIRQLLDASVGAGASATGKKSGAAATTMEALSAQLTVGDRSTDSYLRNFKWNTVKYRTDRSIKDIADALLQEVLAIEALVKTKLAANSQVKASLAAIQRKQTGNLSVRGLADVVRKEHMVQDSEYLKTIIVAVPKPSYKEFIMSYERLTDMVVPRSAVLIAEDEEFGLYGVTVFQRVADEFVAKLREMKYAPREFTYDEQQMTKDKRLEQELAQTAKEQGNQLLRLCKTNFGEVFSAWIHIKAQRVFIDAVLRYGLPPDFRGMLIKVKPKQEKAVATKLNQHYAHLGSSLARDMPSGKTNSKDDPQLEEMVQGLNLDKNYFPFVNFELDWEYQ